MELTVGAILEGKVKSITNFGAFISLPEGKTGMGTTAARPVRTAATGGKIPPRRRTAPSAPPCSPPPPRRLTSCLRKS